MNSSAANAGTNFSLTQYKTVLFFGSAVCFFASGAFVLTFVRLCVIISAKADAIKAPV